MSNNKQSSVEWLQTQLKKGISFNPLDPLSYPKAVDNLFEQAKAMHKQECVDLLNHHNDIFDTSEEHYNKTFK